MISQTLAGLTPRSLILDHSQGQVEEWEGWGHQHPWSFVSDTPFPFSHGTESYAGDKTIAGQLIHLSSDPGVTSSGIAPLDAGGGGCTSLVCGSSRHLEAVFQEQRKGMSLPPRILLRYLHYETSLLPRMGSVDRSTPAFLPTFTGPLCFFGVAKGLVKRHMHAGSRVLTNSSFQFSGLLISRHPV